MDHVLPELSTMTHLSWVALCGMVHGFIELGRADCNVEVYKLSYIKHTASGNLLHDSESSKPVLCDSLQVWGGVGSVREAEREGLCVYLYG